MAEPRKSISDREYDKFTADSQGLTAVRGVVEGNFSFSGLRIGGRITEVILNDSTWVALPATALTDRNSISIQNISGTEMKIQYDNTTVGYKGVAIGAGGERFYDLTDAIVIYAKALTGTPTIIVEELA